MSYPKYTGEPPAHDEVPPDDLNELPSWQEIEEACEGLSLNEPFDVYRIKEAWQGHPAGSVIVLCKDRFYVQPAPDRGWYLKLKEVRPELTRTAQNTDCRECPLWAGRSLVVEGSGPYNPDLMIIGEAPGAEEDMCGAPFVGRSGQLLRAYLAELGLSSDRYYMTNAVRCRPPENRNPSHEEIRACSHWLREEVERVKPRAVLLVGIKAQEAWQSVQVTSTATAAEKLFGPTADESSIRVFTAYHPAYLLRNPGKRPEWRRQLSEAVSYVVSAGSASTLTASATSGAAVLASVPWTEGGLDWEADVLAVDTETVNLEERHASRVVTVQVVTGESAQLYRPVHPVAVPDRPLRVRCPASLGQAPEGAPAGVLREVGEVPGGGRQSSLPPERLCELEAHHRGVPRGEPFTEPLSEHWTDHEISFTQRRFIYHNVKYDLPKIGGDLRKLDTWEDTALMAYVLRYPRVGLKEIGPDLTGIPMERISSVLGSGKNRVDFAGALERDYERAARYALTDAVVTARMYPLLLEQLRASPTQHRYYREMEKPVVPVVYDMEQAGVLIDRAALDKLKAQLVDARDQAKAYTHLWLGEDINLNSGRDLAKALQSELGVTLKAKTPTGQWQLDKTQLLKLAGVAEPGELGRSRLHLAVKSLLSYRQYAKLLSTYVANLEKTGEDGRIRTNFNQMVTDTNRFSSSDPLNLQNIPIRDKHWGKPFRRVVIAKPGHVIVKADYSQLELRIYAHYTREQVLLDAYTGPEERDIHGLFAARWGVDRSVAKNGVFGLVYGVEGPKLAATLGIPPDRIPAFMEHMRQEMPSIAGGWRAYIADRLGTLGYVETAYGWRNYYPLYRSPLRSERQEALRAAANCPIQGTAGGILKRLLRLYDAWRQSSGAYDSQLILMVHDEVVFEVPEQYAREFCNDLEVLGREAGADLSVPLKLEASVGPSWADLTEWKQWQPQPRPVSLSVA